MRLFMQRYFLNLNVLQFNIILFFKNRKDHQVLLAMGNYYYYQYIHKKDESSLKMAYKFYYPTLAENTKNIYATNGLGVVCAEKKEFEAAREIFSKVSFVPPFIFVKLFMIIRFAKQIYQIRRILTSILPPFKFSKSVMVKLNGYFCQIIKIL